MTEASNNNDSGYLNRRAFQQLENMGEGQNAAKQTVFDQVKIEKRGGSYSRVGRNLEDGVAVEIEKLQPLETTITPGILTVEEAKQKAERTGLNNVRVEDGYYVGDHPEHGLMMMGSAEGNGEGIQDTDEDSGINLGQVETFLNAPFAGLSRGVLRAGANALGATGIMEQKDIDGFLSAIDDLNTKAVQDNPAASVTGTVSEIAGQYVLPAATIYKGISALGATPLLSSIIAESSTGLLAVSPNEENLFNMISEDPNTLSTVRELMATDPDDGEWENRARNATEALALLGVGEILIRDLVKLIEKGKRVEKTPVAQEIMKLTDEANLSDNPLEGVEELTEEIIPENTGPFFSAVHRALDSLPQDKGTGDQMRAMIARGKDVKPEEMTWTGLDDFLEGKESVTKQEIDEYMQQNAVSIQEVVLDTQGPAQLTQHDYEGIFAEIADAFEDSYSKLRDSGYDVIEQGGELRFNHPEDGLHEVEDLPGELRESAHELSDAFRIAANDKVTQTNGSARFSEYTLQGGENYKEHLLALPKGETLENTGKTPENDYVSTHFSTPNILAHIRTTDRVGPNGEKILFLEEIQSDWHQQGRRRGYKKSSDKYSGMGEMFEDFDKFMSSHGLPQGLSPSSAKEAISEGRLALTGEKALDQLDEFIGFEEKLTDFDTPMVPDAPLKKTWHEMAFRRATHLATTGGYDAVAWTPGQMQMERYSLPEEGMKDFYDKMVKNYAQKFGKKFGAKVNTIEIQSVNPDRIPGATMGGNNPYTISSSVDSDQVEVLYLGQGQDDVDELVFTGTREDANKFIEDELDKLDTQEVWSMNITDEMRSTISSKGVPLFSVAPLAAAPLMGHEEEQPEGVQVASASSRFLRAILGNTPEKAADAARSLSNYKAYKDQVPNSVDFNMDNIHTTDDVKNQINIVSEAYSGVEGTPIPQDITRDIAQLLGQDQNVAEQAVRSLPGDVKDLHVRALTMRNLLVASAEKTDELARVVANGGKEVSDGDYLRFRQQIVRHAQLQRNMKGVQSEIGRALASFRIPAEAGVRNPQIAHELIDRLGGRGTAVEIANRWLTTPVHKRAKFADRSMWAKTRAAVFEMWINGLLSGARTHQVNSVGNILFSMFQVPERVGAAAVGAALRNPDRVRFRETLAMARGSAEGAVEGIRLAWKAWKTEMPTDGIAKIEAQTMKAITPENFNVNPDSLGGKAIDLIGQGLRLPGRALMTEDEFFKAIGYRMELRSLTTRKILQARDEGRVADMIIDLSNHADEADFEALTRLRETADARQLNREELSELESIMLNNPMDELDSASHDFATMVTFQTELGEAGKALQTAVAKIPGARIIAPFIRTPTNIVKEFGRRGPAAMMMPSVHKMLKEGGAQRDLAIARLGLGSSLMTWAAFLHQDGVITGGGPSRGQGTYNQWRATHEPYSVKLNGKWYPYGRLEPLGMLFGSVADAGDFMAYSDDEDSNQQVYFAALAGVLKNLGDKTTMQGISNFSEAYNDFGMYGERYVANLARSAIPFSSMVRDITRANDPIMRETRSDPMKGDPFNETLTRVINEMKAGIPGLSDDLPPKRTFWGEERRAYQGGPANSFYAFKTYDIKKSPIDEELVRLNSPLKMPSRRVGEYELTNDQYDRLVVLMNQSPADMPDMELITKYGSTKMKTAMDNLVQSELWKQIESDDVKKTFLMEVRNDYVEAARRSLAREDSKVSEAKVEEDTQKIMLKGQESIMKQLGPMNSQISPPEGVN